MWLGPVIGRPVLSRRGTTPDNDGVTQALRSRRREPVFPDD